MSLLSLSSIINENSTFMVASHIMPDGDSIGSLLAMSCILKKLGKKVTCIINDSIPDKYTFLPGVENITREQDLQFDVLIALDCGDEERLGLSRGLRNYAKTIVNIDHHKSNSRFGDFNLINEHASSVGEMIYTLTSYFRVSLDYEIAVSIYTSIITDTGSVKYSNTTADSLRILAELVEIGVRPDYISRKVFETKSREYTTLLKMVLDSLEIINDNIAVISITRDMMQKSKAKEEDTDGMINFAREIKGIEVAVLLREKSENLIKVGFRSNEWCDVSKIAEELGGGGHARASGCNYSGGIDKAKEDVINCIMKHMAGDCFAGNN